MGPQWIIRNKQCSLHYIWIDASIMMWSSSVMHIVQGFYINLIVDVSSWKIWVMLKSISGYLNLSIIIPKRSDTCFMLCLHKVCPLMAHCLMHGSTKFQTPPNAVDLLWSCEGLWRGLSFVFSRSDCHLTI